MTFHEFCDAARSYCTLTGGSVTSWGRTAKRNTAVKGVARSAHRAWLAVDVVYDAPAPPASERKDWAARLGLWLLVEDDHDHLQAIPWKAG